MFYNLSQVFAFGSLIVTCLSTWGKKRNMVSMLVLDSFFLGCCYFLLGEYSGSVTSIVCVLRSVVALFFEKHPYLYRNFIPWVFATVYLSIGIITFSGFPSIIATSAGLISCFSVFSRNDSVVRISIAAVIFLWLGYDICVHSYLSMIGETISALTAIVSIYTNELLPRMKKTTAHAGINM